MAWWLFSLARRKNWLLSLRASQLGHSRGVSLRFFNYLASDDPYYEPEHTLNLRRSASGDSNELNRTIMNVYDTMMNELPFHKDKKAELLKVESESGKMPMSVVLDMLFMLFTGNLTSFLLKLSVFKGSGRISSESLLQLFAIF